MERKAPGSKRARPRTPGGRGAWDCRNVEYAGPGAEMRMSLQSEARVERGKGKRPNPMGRGWGVSSGEGDPKDCGGEGGGLRRSVNAGKWERRRGARGPTPATASWAAAGQPRSPRPGDPETLALGEVGCAQGSACPQREARSLRGGGGTTAQGQTGR